MPNVPRVRCSKCRRFKWADVACRCVSAKGMRPYKLHTDGLVGHPKVPRYDPFDDSYVTARPKYVGTGLHDYGDGNGGSW